MVDTCRCPKASYSVSSIIFGVSPRREAVLRSMVSAAFMPLSSWSLLTSTSCGSARSCWSTRGTQAESSREALALQRELVLRIARPAADAHVLHGLQVEGGARHRGQLAAQASR